MNAISKTIANAYQAVKESGIPEQLQSVAFKWALATTSTFPDEKSFFLKGEHLDQKKDPRFAKLSKELGIDEAHIRDMFDIEEDSISLTLSSKQLMGKKSQAVKEVALLLGFANEVLLEKSATSFSEVRNTTEFLGCADPSNFSKLMKQMDTQIKIKGSGRNAQYSLKMPGREEAIRIAKEITEKA